MMRCEFSYTAVFVLMLTTVFSGCRREPLPNTDLPIQFSVGLKMEASSQTKADTPDQASTPADNLVKDGSVIRLYGSVTPAGSEKAALFGDEGTELTCSESSGVFTWNYASPKYWTRGSQYRFRAISPNSSDIQSGSDEEIVVNYSMEKVQNSKLVRNDYDLLFASASVEDAPPANNTVSLTFNHACAAVRFQFSDGSLTSDTADSNYYIKSFELQNLFTEGIFTYNNTGETWDKSGSSHIPSIFQWSGKWGVKKTPRPITGLDWFFVVPQELLGASDRVHTAVHFTFVRVADGKEGLEIPVTFNLGTYRGEDVAWEQGKMYSYIIELQPSESSISFTVEDWVRSYVAVDDLIF